MTGNDFKLIRQLYGESQLVFGRRLGFDTEPADTVRRKVRRYESGATPIVGTMAALLLLLRELKLKSKRKRVSADIRRPSKGTQGGTP